MRLNWRIGAGLVGAPLVALGVQSVMYALVLPACASQQELWVHLAAGAALLATVAATAAALSEWRARGGLHGQSADSDQRDSNGPFTAALATGVAAVSGLVVAAMWLGAWLLPACWR